MVRLPLDGDVGRRRLLSSRDGIDHLNERLCVALFLLAAPLLVAAVRLLVVLRARSAGAVASVVAATANTRTRRICIMRLRNK